MGEKQFHTLLSVVSGAVLTWIFFGLAWWRTRVPRKHRLRARGVVVFKLKAEWRYAGPVMTFLSLLLIVLIMFGVPEHNYKPGDWILSFLSLGLLFGGLGTVGGAILWLSRFKCCDEGVQAWSVWAMPRFLAWADLEQVSVSDAMQSYKLKGRPASVYVPLYLAEHERFLSLVKHHAPHAVWDASTQETPQAISEAAHFRSLNNMAPRMATISALAVLASFFFMPPTTRPLLLSAVAGWALVLYPAYRNIHSGQRPPLGGLVQILGMGSFFYLTKNIHQYYGMEESAVDGYTGAVLIVQTFGMALLSGSVLLLYSRRFSRRMPGS